MATIIQVWTQNAKRLYPDDPDYITFIGLGDLIRGSIGLYRLSKKLGCDFQIRLNRNVCMVNNSG